MPVPGSEALFARLRPFALAERSESDTPRFGPDVGERSCSSRERRTARLEARASRAAIPSPRSGCRAVVSFAGRVRSRLRSIDPIPVGSRPVPAKGRPARKARRRATVRGRASPTRAGSCFTAHGNRLGIGARRPDDPRPRPSRATVFQVARAVPSTRRWCTPRADR